MKLYVFGKSKREINERLAAAKPVFGTNYSIFGNEGGTYKLDDTLAKGTVIVVYDRADPAGNPIGKHYGTWQKGKVA